MSKAVGYRGKSRLSHAKGAPPGVGNKQSDDGLGIPTDTLASSAKSKSLTGRNRELRFICEREKRILDWDWHRVKVGFEKEKMIFKKRALRMLEAPRYRYHTPKDEEPEEVVTPETPTKTYLERRRQTIAATSGVDKQLNSSSSRSRTPSFNSSDDCVMLEELQELNARLNVEKKACRSAPLVKNSVLTDPLYQLSSRLPKLEEEFSDMIKEHNALRRKKVDYKIKDFLVRVENFKLDQREPKGLHLLHRDPVTVTFDGAEEEQGGEENGEMAITQGERNMFMRTPSAFGKKNGHKIPPHSAGHCNGSGVRPKANGTSGSKRPGSSNIQDLEDEVFDPPLSTPSTDPKNSKSKPSKIDVEKSVMLDTWEEFSRNMSLEGMKKLVTFATKNKNAPNAKTNSQDPKGSKNAKIYRQVLSSTSSGAGEVR